MFRFLLVFFLIMIVLWMLTRVPWGVLILLGVVLLLLAVSVVGIWLFVRSRRYVYDEIEKEKPGKAFQGAALRSVGLEDLLRLSPSEFEDFVGDLLEVAGRCSDVRRIGGAGDHGADLLAKDRFGRPFIVQCKRYGPGRKVVAKEMRDFLGSRLYYHADEGMFVTTSVFTNSAREEMAQFYRHIFLLEGQGLMQLAQEYWEALPSRWRQRLY
jgi:restriction system protein